MFSSLLRAPSLPLLLMLEVAIAVVVTVMVAVEIAGVFTHAPVAGL